MIQLETQVAKIQIGDTKQASTYVHVLAKKVASTDTELYVLCELPMFNPAAQADCQTISEAISSSLYRSYRKTVNQHTFENALSQINEELGKLSSLGKIHWIDKLNALVAAKHKNKLHISTVGKINALMYREGAFNAISESNVAPTALKIFDSFSVGKLLLDDLLVFSTTQLLNHISIDRFQQILEEGNLPESAGVIVDTLHDNAGPEVACGAILALQVEPGLGEDEVVDLDPYVANAQPIVKSNEKVLSMKERLQTLGSSGLEYTTAFTKHAIASIRNKKKPDLIKVFKKTTPAFGEVSQQFRKAVDTVNPGNISRFSTSKKLFFVSAIILLIAIITSVSVSNYYKNRNQQTEQSQTALNDAERLINDANASFIYNDKNQAQTLYDQAKNLLAGVTETNDNSEKLSELRGNLQKLDDTLNNRITAEVSQLGILSSSSHLIVTPQYFASEISRNIVSFDRADSTIQENELQSGEPIVSSSTNSSTQTIIYNGQELYIWNPSTGGLIGGFDNNVPSSDNFGGMKIYSVNKKLYLVNRSDRTVYSYSIGANSLGDGSASLTDDLIGNATDIAIDGSIYVISQGKIFKFLSGVRQEFNFSQNESLNNQDKIYTQSDYQDIYLLDTQNKQIIIMDKSGNVKISLISPQFTDLKDFYVDEKDKSIYVLNESALLKVKF